MTAAIAYLLLRKKKSNPGPTPVPVPVPGGGNITGFPVKRVAKVAPESFFSALVLPDGTMLAGTYSHPKATSHIIKIGRGSVASLNTGESVFDMIEHEGHIYASCENKGLVCRAKTPWYDFNPYATLRPGLHGGAFGMGVVFGKLVVIGGGEIFVKGIGTVKTFDKDTYVKWPFEFKGMCIIPGYRRSSDSAGWYESKDLRSWSWKNKIKGHRFMSGAVRPDGKEMALCGSDNYRGGKHHDNSASMYKCTDGVTVKQQGHFNDFDYIPVCRFYNNSQLLFGPNRGWRDPGSGAPLMARYGGKFETLATFPEAEIRGIEIAGDKVLVVTRTDQKRGCAYLVGSEKVDVPKDVRALTKDGEMIWKPVSAGSGYGGNLAIILPRKWHVGELFVNGEKAYDGKHSKELNDRQVWRTHKPGSAYPANTIIHIGPAIKRRVPDPAKRYGRKA